MAKGNEYIENLIQRSKAQTLQRVIEDRKTPEAIQVDITNRGLLTIGFT